MLIAADAAPADSDLLCEGCGYILNGLPAAGNCPECGKPILQSTGEHRHLAEFERHPSAAAFLSTSGKVIFHTGEFYRTLLVRCHSDAARAFALLNITLASILFTLAACGHALWVLEIFSMPALWSLVVLVLGLPSIMVALLGLTKLAAWLSALEARYWGMRLPYRIVERALAFHSANYLPVGLMTGGLVWGYRLLLHQRWCSHLSDTRYLYALSGAVVLLAAYLFRSYWIAMKNIMHANR